MHINRRGIANLKELSGSHNRRPFQWLAAILLVPLLLAGQTPQETKQPKLSAEVKLVTVYATVRDKHGKIIPNLSQTDFSLDEDSRQQKISYFARESDLPLTLGLLVDTSLSQRRILGSERDASYTFLNHILRQDKDKAFLIHFDREVELLQDLTSYREKLRAALDDIQSPQRENASSGSGGHGHGGGGTLLYDAIYLASDELMKKQQARKALIILTDGVDHGSKESLSSAIESAQRADTAVFSILFADDQAYDHGGGYGGYGGGHGGWGGGHSGGQSRRYPQQDRPDGKKVLQRISQETGGQFVQVSKKLTVDQIYDEIQESLRNQYSLGYTPDRPNPGAGYHTIRLQVSQKDLVVKAREGYYSEK